MHNDIVSALFTTKAACVSPAEQPFWYTSGKIGPYYINTHYLYGSEEKASELLSKIDGWVEDKFCCASNVMTAVVKNYRSDPIYASVIDAMAEYIRSNIDIDSFDYISGGARRDWYFSLMLAHIFSKPHITIFKDLTYTAFDGKSSHDVSIAGCKVLHIADIITEAASYTRAWIPALKQAGADMTDSMVVIDRMQGGSDVLIANGVKSHSLVRVDVSLFESANSLHLIDDGQLELVKNYINDPGKAMTAFIKAHPEFLENALNSDAKTASRARLCIENKFYR